MAEAAQSGGRSNKAAKRRTPISCDRCKSRKTKCVDPEPGPCKYCAHIGVPCRLSARRNQRPFYHVTEEEYRCSRKILEHLLPLEDLTLERLRNIASDIDNGSPIHTANLPRSPESKVDDGIVDSGQDTEELGDLHEELGCLMEDSLGEYRYVGAHSEIAFNAAVCSMKAPKAPSSPESIIEPSKFAFPPRRPSVISHFDKIYLPPRELADHYVARYFEEVHCIYWLYPAEHFYLRLDATYEDEGCSSSRSWLCALYSIFALGLASGTESAGLALENRTQIDSKSSDEYLNLAKSLVPQVQDEADIESVRGLALLGIALQTFSFRITSYLYMGTSIRIAFSLGLHHDRVHKSQTLMTREQNRRIWWTLYILDQAISSRCGSPFIIDERSLSIQTPLPSERIATPGMNTPLGIMSVSTSICRLRRQIIQTIYPERSADPRRVSYATITHFLSELQNWNKSLPSHLKWGVPVAPSHRRAVAILHLNYWDATMLITQPFLLYLVLRGKNIRPTKKKWFERLSDTCIEAATSALFILKQMATEKTLSSLITLDVTCGLKVVMILVLAFARNNSEDRRRDIEACLALLRGMEQVGFCGTATKELPIRLADLGILKESEEIENLQNGVDQSFQLFDSIEGFQNLNTDFRDPFWMDSEINMGIFGTPGTDSFSFESIPSN